MAQSVFNRFAGVVVPLLCELESSEKCMCVEENSVGPCESLIVEKPVTLERTLGKKLYDLDGLAVNTKSA